MSPFAKDSIFRNSSVGVCFHENSHSPDTALLFSFENSSVHVLYFHVNEPLAKDHPSGKTVVLETHLFIFISMACK